MDSLLIYLFLFIIAFLFANILIKITSGKKPRTGTAFRHSRKHFVLLKFLLLISVTLAAMALLFFSAFLRSFHAFTHKELVAVVRCERAIDQNADFTLELILVENDKKWPSQSFAIKGDQWAVAGDILKWRDFINFLGLHTMYRLTRIEGRHASAAEASTKITSAYSLGKDERGLFWRILYKYGSYVPLITSVYGNTVFLDPNFDQNVEIYVTTSGFMAQRAEE